MGLTFATAYTGGVVAFGSSLLQSIASTEASTASVYELIRNAESQPPPSGRNAEQPETAAEPFVRLCDRPKLLRWEREQGYAPKSPALPQKTPGAQSILPPVDIFNSESERLICDQLADQTRKLQIEYDNLYRFEWRVIYVYELPVVIVDNLRRWFAGELGLNDERSSVPAAIAKMGTPEGDQWLTASLSALGSFMLPMLFTILGSAVSIARDLYGRVRQATLDPRDATLSLARLALGIVAGTAIGLFVTPTSSAGGGSPGASSALPLTASGLAFLAGYGIDAVFQFFDGLLQRFNPDGSGNVTHAVAPEALPAPARAV